MEVPEPLLVLVGNKRHRSLRVLMIKLGMIIMKHPAPERARIKVRIPPRVKAKVAMQPKRERVIPGKVGRAAKEELKVPRAHAQDRRVDGENNLLPLPVFT